MKKVYRPAGGSILLRRTQVTAGLFSSYEYRLFQSGTASLAAAIQACMMLKKVTGNKPEIILPAYACPDIISAVLSAGAKPILVDLENDSSFLSEEFVKKSITNKTIAIISVNFLGLPGNINELGRICENQNLFLIYDCAQWFPLDENFCWPGDFNIISFGRGKPINLLHGGAVILKDPVIAKALPNLPASTKVPLNKLAQSLKIRIYNLIIHPMVFRFFTQLPGLNIGQTLYRPLEAIYGMDPFYVELIKHNINKFRLQTGALQYLHKRMTGITHPLLTNLVFREFENQPDFVLRYPILIKNKAIRDQFYEQTRDYGTSLLYRNPLNQIRGLEKILELEPVYPNANTFSDHLITLPCHEDIDNDVVDVIVDELQSLLANQS